MTTPSFPTPPGQAPLPVQPSAASAPLRSRRWFPWALGAVCLFVGIGLGSAGNGSANAGAATATSAASVSEPRTTVFKTIPATDTAETVTATTTVTAKPAAPPKPKTTTAMDGDGTYLVGTDVKAGTYRARPASGETCYWARLRSLDGGMNAIIANNLSEGPQVMRVLSSDKAVEVRSCGTWTRIS